MTVCVQSWSPEKERPRALAAAVQLAALLIAISHVAVLRVRYDAAEARAPEPASAKIARLTDRIALGGRADDDLGEKTRDYVFASFCSS